ncbi:hypothetical protein QTP88_020020 [Uroleucon formosanum]
MEPYKLYKKSLELKRITNHEQQIRELTVYTFKLFTSTMLFNVREFPEEYRVKERYYSIHRPCVCHTATPLEINHAEPSTTTKRDGATPFRRRVSCNVQARVYIAVRAIRLYVLIKDSNIGIGVDIYNFIITYDRSNFSKNVVNNPYIYNILNGKIDLMIYFFPETACMLNYSESVGTQTNKPLFDTILIILSHKIEDV